jgi:hypothetical protein
LENLATLTPGGIVFVAAVAAAMLLHDLWMKRRGPAQAGALANAADG